MKLTKNKILNYFLTSSIVLLFFSAIIFSQGGNCKYSVTDSTGGSGDEPVPNAPSNLSVSIISPTAVSLNWQDNSKVETGFIIERKDGLTGSYTTIGMAGINQTSFTDSTVSGSNTYFYRVISFNASGNSGYTNVDSNLPLMAVSQYPGIGMSSVPITPLLSWASAGRTTSYDVYFGATSTPVFVLNTTATSYTPGALLYITTYYWRVDSVNSAATTTGNLWYFTTQVEPAPAQVTSPTPANNAINVPISQVLSWAAADRALYYDVYIGLTTTNWTPVTTTDLTNYIPGFSLIYDKTYYWRVDAKNFSGTTLGNIWLFTATSAPPAQVTSPVPPSGATNVIITQILSWAAASGALSYDVYLNTNPTLTFIINTSSTSYAPSLLPNTQYYWRIDSKNNAGVTIGNIWTFTTLALPAQVSSPNPVDGQQNTSITLQLTWSAAPLAVSYDVYFGTTITPAYIANTTNISYAPGVLVYDTDYYWRIDAKNSSGATTGPLWTFSTLAPPDKTAIIAPIDSAAGILIDQVLSWTASARAESYDVYFGLTTTGWVAVTSITFTSYVLLLEWGTTYYWRVDAINAAGIVEGDTLLFTTLFPPGEVTGPMYPGNGAVNIPINLTLTWTSATLADSYDIYLDTTFTDWAPLTNTTLTYYTPLTLTPGTDYYWRVDSINPAALVSGTVWSFTTLPLPQDVTLVAPANSAIEILLDQPLQWNESAYADTYDIYFGTANPPPYVTTVLSPTLTYAPALLSYTLYYWRIGANNASGGKFSPIWQFTTQALPAKVANLFPPNNSISILIIQNFTWSAASRADSYDVYFGTTLTGLSLITNTDLTNYTANFLQWQTTYYWRIDSRNELGTTTGDTLQFTTLFLPAQAANPDPSSGALHISATPQLTWDAAARATSYDVYFGTTATPVFVLNTAGTSYTPGTLIYDTTYYWHVDAKNTAGITAGSVWNFIVTSPAPDPVTAPVSPLDGAVDISINTTLIWEPAPRILAYDIYVGMTSTNLALAGSSVVTSYALATLIPGTTYYWRIDARNTDGTAQSTVWNFSTLPLPDLVAGENPADNSLDLPITATLSWSAADNANSYDVYFGTITATPVFKTNTTGLTYDPGVLLYNTVYSWHIDAKNPSGTAIGSNWIFRTRIAPPEQAGSPDPTDNAVDITITPTLTWIAGLRSFSFDVYFGVTTTDWAPVTNTDSTFYSASGMAYNTLYYWRIDAVNTTGTTQGQLWKFTTSDTPPDQSANPVPQDSASDIPITQTMHWNTSARATSYDVYYGTTTTDWTPVANITSTNYNPTTLSYNTLYYWRVDAKNGSAIITGDTWIFITAEPVPDPVTNPSPQNEAMDISVNQSLTWAASDRATSYDVYLGITTTPEFLLNTINNYYSPITFEYTTVYYWRVDARNGSGTATGELWSFTTADTIPDIVTTAYPENGATDISINLILIWLPSDRATSYDVYFDTTTTDWTPVTNTAITVYEPLTLTYNTLYFWQVDAKNGSGTATGDTWSFTTTEEIPDPVTQIYPENEAVDISVNVVLTWTASSRATSYDIYFGITTTDWLPITNTILTSYTPITELQYSTLYYWRVDAGNAAGSVPSDTWFFTTSDTAPDIAADPTPADEAINIQLDQILTWTSSARATSYDVYFDTTTTDWTPVTNTTLTGYELLTLTYATLYYWRIDARNGSSVTEGNIWSFTTIEEPPEQAFNPAPENGAVDIPTDQILNWADSARAASYDIYFGTTTTDWTPVINTALTTYDPLPLSYDTTYYWRIDAVNLSGTTEGIIWSFRTLLEP